MKTIAYAMAEFPTYREVKRILLRGMGIIGKDMLRNLALKYAMTEKGLQELEEKLLPKTELLSIVDKDTVYFDGLEKIKKEMEKIVKSTNKRIVVFIDDLDRCSPDTTLEVFESIKAFLELEGFIYIVGLSFDTVSKLIEAEYKESKIKGEDYIRKIIQLPIFIPEWNDSKIIKNLIQNLSTRLNTEYSKLVNDNSEIIAKAVELNPREVKRFINYFILAYEILSSKAVVKNAKELLIVQALRVRWNRFYSYISTHEKFREAVGEYAGLPEDERKLKFASRRNDKANPLNGIEERVFEFEADAELWDFLENNKEVTQIRDWGLYRGVVESLKEEREIINKESLLDLLKKGNVEEFNRLRGQKDTASEPPMSLHGLDLTGLNLSGINLSNMLISGCKFTNTNLTKANLSSIELAGGDSPFADFSNANFSEAKLTRAHIYYADFIGADFGAADLSYADLTSSNFSNADFQDANFTGANLSEVIFASTNLTNSSLIDVKTNSIRVDLNTKTHNVKLVPSQHQTDSSILRRSLDGINKKLREIIVRDNPNLLPLEAESHPEEATIPQSLSSTKKISIEDSESQYSSHKNLALKWAPINLQFIRLDPENDYYSLKKDLVVPVDLQYYKNNQVDLESRWDTRNIRERLREIKIEQLKPVVYYSTAETESHYYILYSFYHADDDTHPNDMEGCLVLLEKQENSQLLLGIITVAHYDLWKYAYKDNLLHGSGKEFTEMEQLEVDEASKRPLIQTESGKHGIYGIPSKSSTGTNFIQGIASLVNIHGNSIVLYPSTDAFYYNIESIKKGKNTPYDPFFYYELVDILDPAEGLWELWKKKPNSTFDKHGKFHGGSANPPWLWKVEYNLRPLEQDNFGLMWSDPVKLATKIFKPGVNRKEFSPKYIRHMDGT